MTATWDHTYDLAQARYGPLDLGRSALDAGLREHLTRRLAPLGLAPLEGTLDDLLRRSAGADLALVLALEAGVPGAAERLRRELAPALAELARKRGVVPGLAARYVDGVLDQALARPEDGTGRTRLAAYDGSGTLATWLALALEERVLDDARQPAPGEAPPPPPPPMVAREHPSANLLAGLAEGRLLPEEAGAVLTHVSACERCRGLLRGLELAGIRPAEVVSLTSDITLVRAPTRTRLPQQRPTRRMFGILLGIGLVTAVVVLATTTGGRTLFDHRARSQDTEQEVFDAAARLGNREPGLFGDFEPYTRGELERGTARPTGDLTGPRAVHPRDQVLVATPTFLWHALEGATRYVLTLRDEDGSTLWTGTVEGTSLAWPAGLAPLDPGLPVTWEVAAEGVPEPGTRTRFSAALERDTVRWERRLASLAENVSDARVRGILTAQVALRRGHLWEAWTAIQAHVRTYPHDAYGEAFEIFLRRVHGFR